MSDYWDFLPTNFKRKISFYINLSFLIFILKIELKKVSCNYPCQWYEINTNDTVYIKSFPKIIMNDNKKSQQNSQKSLSNVSPIRVAVIHIIQI